MKRNIRQELNENMLLANVFLYIFNPYIIGINSVYMVFAFYTAKFFIDKKYKAILLNRAASAEIVRVFLTALLVVFVSMVTILVHGTQDVTFLVPFLNQIFKLFVGVLIYAHFLQSGKTNAILYCIYAFGVQAILQILSFFSPAINELFNIFRDPYAVEIGKQQYGGYRGLVVGSSSFFSVSAAYALIFVIVVEYWSKLDFPKLIKWLMIGVMGFAAISAGRTAFGGMIMAIIAIIILKFMNYRTQKKKRKMQLSTLAIVLFCGIVSSILILCFLNINGVINIGFSKSAAYKIESYLRYAFEFVYNYLNGNGFTTSSTEMLSGMYFPVSTKTFLLGDGQYTSEFGGYYMSTDAGYMRQILYFGLFGFAVMLLFQLMFFLYKQNKKTKVFSAMIIVLLMILHYKGEVIGYLQITQSILLLRMLSQINEAE